MLYSTQVRVHLKLSVCTKLMVGSWGMSTVIDNLNQVTTQDIVTKTPVHQSKSVFVVVVAGVCLMLFDLKISEFYIILCCYFGYF